MCLAEGGNHLRRRDWGTLVEKCSGAGPLKVDTSPVTSVGEGIGPALLPVPAFARGPEGTGKLSPLPSHSIPLLCFVLSAGCSGGRAGAELCDCDSSHSLGDASLREYQQQELP